MTNLCRLFLISLSSHQHLQTVVWSIPGKMWGRDGRCTVPQPLLQSGTSPVSVPRHTSPLLCTAQERAAGRFDKLQALSPNIQVQQSRSGTTLSITKGSAAHSLLPGAGRSPRCAALLSQAKCKEGFVFFSFLTLWSQPSPAAQDTTAVSAASSSSSKENFPLLPAPLPAHGSTCIGLSCPCTLLFWGCQE